MVPHGFTRRFVSSLPRLTFGVTLVLVGRGCAHESPGADTSTPVDPLTVDIPAGTFWMGCNESLDTDCDSDEFPYHELWISHFEIQRTELDVSTYFACVDDASCTQPSGVSQEDTEPDMPVTGVTRDQAAQACEWLDMRLPTEAEWEKAARGTDERVYPWGNDEPDCDLANMRICGDLEPVDSHPVGASPYGALNMSGNAWEWVSDDYDETYYSDSPDADPQGPSGSFLPLVRGVNYYSSMSGLRASNRELAVYSASCSLCGFRCARSLE